MNALKEIMMKGMGAIMLDCDKATLYATKYEFHSLSCIKKIQLKMHMASCKFCRSFVKHSKILTEEINSVKEIDGTNLTHHLTEEQKEHLQETVESYY